jgi:hypothetical protein
MKMYKIITFTIIVLINNYSFGQGIDNEKNEKYPLKSILCFCQSSPDILFSETSFKYDTQHRLIEKNTIMNGLSSEKKIIKYFYNEFGLIYSKHFIQENPNHEKKIRKYIYKYDDNKRLIYEGFDDDKGNNTEIKYYYSKHNKIIEKYTTCNYFKSSYTYEFDNLSRVISEKKDNQLISTYTYSDDHLIIKIQYVNNKEITFVYEYDENNNLILVKQNGEIIEQNEYKADKLIKKIENYVGIDPCYYPCCGKYIKKYLYE